MGRCPGREEVATAGAECRRRRRHPRRRRRCVQCRARWGRRRRRRRQPLALPGTDCHQGWRQPCQGVTRGDLSTVACGQRRSGFVCCEVSPCFSLVASLTQNSFPFFFCRRRLAVGLPILGFPQPCPRHRRPAPLRTPWCVTVTPGPSSGWNSGAVEWTSQGFLVGTAAAAAAPSPRLPRHNHCVHPCYTTVPSRPTATS